MKRPFFVMVMCALLVGAFCLPALFAADAPKNVIEMKMPSGTPTKTPVKFNHAGPGHKALDCKACHHTGKDSGCAVAGCHDNVDPADKTSAKSFYMAFHKGDSAHSCLGCHKKAKADGKNAPISCTQCHPK